MILITPTTLIAGVVAALAGVPKSLTDATNAIADARSLSAMHERLGSEPHVAGTPGDARQIERIADAFRELGLDVEIHRFRALLARPVEARLEILGEPSPDGARRGVVAIDLREKNLLEDPSTAHPDLTYGWNAYSGSGDVTAPIVYANYGTREDFAKLAELGVDPRGKIVLARYGGNFRGYKAKFAEEAGAAGLLIYTDPAGSGFVRGPTWPAGGWSNDTCIQRGSLVTLPWPGDPLTPGIEATVDAKRLDVTAIALPKIPVQPIGYAAAERIIARMTGPEVKDPAWKGGIRQTYRLEGGDELKVRLHVQQERFLGESANVVATLKGTSKPEELVIIGCHHDAWGFGAADPLAGTMVLMESARSFAEAAARGERPERSLVFAAWGAEEFGIIGSTEWVESRSDRIARDAVAYINLDMASMGQRFGTASSPSLQPAIERAARRAISPFDDQPVFSAWTTDEKGGQRSPPFGEVGGGSDHVAFWCYAGVPCCSLGASGAPGDSYHSNYDTVEWYRKTVGDDYRSALLVTRMTNALVAELASDPLPSVSPGALMRDAIRLFERVDARAQLAGLDDSASALVAQFRAMLPAAESIDRDLELVPAARASTELRTALRSLLTAWMEPAGLPGRPWFRNLYAAPDRSSGYAASMVPLLAEAIEDRDTRAFADAVARYRAIGERLADALRRIQRTMPAKP